MSRKLRQNTIPFKINQQRNNEDQKSKQRKFSKIILLIKGHQKFANHKVSLVRYVYPGGFILNVFMNMKRIQN